MDRDAFDARLVEHRRIWERKATLRAVYRDFHRRLDAACPAGRLLDIGGGSAHFKPLRREVITLDILPFAGVDVVADAHRTPFPDESFAGIAMLDVLHHLQRPLAFLSEASRVLRPGGRLAMIEPGMSALARRLYTHLHQEPVVMSADPFDDNAEQSGADPFDANQALPHLMFATANARRRVEKAAPALKVVRFEWLSLFVYPLSGGFKPWCLWPASLVDAALKLENALTPALGPWLAFRMMAVLEKRS
ncbi:MAG: class I SAM-dependent methyltransferase [Roseiarcus sp.]